MIDEDAPDEAEKGVEFGSTTVSPAVVEDIVVVDHDTLKYSLLGPSLTKAGQDTVDQKKVISPFLRALAHTDNLYRSPKSSTTHHEGPNSSIVRRLETAT